MPVEIAQELVQQDFSSKVEGKCLKFEKIGYSVKINQDIYLLLTMKILSKKQREKRM